MAVMGHDGPLLPSYFAGRESDWGTLLSILIDLQYPCSFIKIKDTKFRCVLRNLLIEILNILRMYFKHVPIACDIGKKLWWSPISNKVQAVT